MRMLRGFSTVMDGQTYSRWLIPIQLSFSGDIIKTMITMSIVRMSIAMDNLPIRVKFLRFWPDLGVHVSPYNWNGDHVTLSEGNAFYCHGVWTDAVYSVAIKKKIWIFMMTSWHGNALYIAGPLWKKSTGDRWILAQSTCNAGLLCLLCF